MRAKPRNVKALSFGHSPRRKAMEKITSEQAISYISELILRKTYVIAKVLQQNGIAEEEAKEIAESAGAMVGEWALLEASPLFIIREFVQSEIVKHGAKAVPQNLLLFAINGSVFHTKRILSK